MSSQPTKEELVTCEWCGRDFTLRGLKAHCAKVHALEMEFGKIGFESAVKLHEAEHEHT